VAGPADETANIRFTRFDLSMQGEYKGEV
jgi:hypothetical protein